MFLWRSRPLVHPTSYTNFTSTLRKERGVKARLDALRDNLQSKICNLNLKACRTHHLVHKLLRVAPTRNLGYL